MNKINQQDQYIEIEWRQKDVFNTAASDNLPLVHNLISATPSACRTAIRVSDIFVIDPLKTCGTCLITRIADADGCQVCMEIYYCMTESAEHFNGRLNSKQKIILLDDDDKPNVATDDTGAISDRQEVKVNDIRWYTAAALITEIEEECFVAVDDIGLVPDTTNTYVSVCVRHDGDRTDCRISHLESKDGHITIVCDAEDNDN